MICERVSSRSVFLFCKSSWQFFHFFEGLSIPPKLWDFARCASSFRQKNASLTESFAAWFGMLAPRQTVRSTKTIEANFINCAIIFRQVTNQKEDYACSKKHTPKHRIPKLACRLWNRLPLAAAFGDFSDAGAMVEVHSLWIGRWWKILRSFGWGVEISFETHGPTSVVHHKRRSKGENFPDWLPHCIASYLSTGHTMNWWSLGQRLGLFCLQGLAWVEGSGLRLFLLVSPPITTRRTCLGRNMITHSSCTFVWHYLLCLLFRFWV